MRHDMRSGRHEHGCLCERRLRDASPDVHGLDSVGELVHTALILQGSQRDDGGVFL